MNCPNCKKDLVAGFECANAACVDLRTAKVEEMPFVSHSVKDIKSAVEKVKRAVRKAVKK